MPAPRSFSLDGVGVGVTGGGGWLGRAMALALAEAGARVAILGRRRELLEAVQEEAADRGSAGTIVAVQGDVGQRADVERTIAAASDGVAFRGWVNNAVRSESSLLGELDRAAVLRTLEGALVDPMLASEWVGAHLIAEGRGGSIVNVGSMYGLVSPDPVAYIDAPHQHNPPAYGAAKAGLAQFSRYCAVHWAPHGIRVNTLTPGPFPGPAAREAGPFVAGLAGRVPLGRVGEPGDLDGAIVFLLSDASSFVTGHELVVDGGWTVV